jgi:group I intron endonuclease
VEKIQGIYAIKNKLNSNVYVGQVSKKKGLLRRFTEHKSLLNKGLHYNKHLQSSWSKYQEHNFEFSLIEEVYDEELLDEREQYWIDVTWNYSYNIQPTSGGNPRGRKHSDETKRKIGEANKRRVWTEDSRRIQSQSQKGKVTSDVCREKRRICQLGRKHSEATKTKISDGNRGKVVSFDSRKKISQARVGRKQSAEAIENRRKTLLLKPPLVGYKGVRKRSQNCWEARAHISGRQFIFGYFPTPEEAAMNYDYHMIMLCGNHNFFINFKDVDYSNFTPKRADIVPEVYFSPLIEGESTTAILSRMQS